MKVDRDWEQPAQIDLRRYWNTIRRKKWTILGFAVAFSLIAAVYVSMMTPIYRTSATVLIESQRANVISIEEVYGLDRTNREHLATQFAVLKSRPIAENVINSLKLLEHPTFSPPEERSSFKLDWQSWLTFVRSKLPGEPQSEPQQELIKPEDEILDLDWRSWFPFARSGRSIRVEPDPLQEAVERYFEVLTIEPTRDTQLVKMSFESADPVLATKIANAHAQAYIESILDARVAMTRSAASWMTKRLEGLQRSLLESEQRLQEFREREQS